jgi:hypothetical protein
VLNISTYAGYHSHTVDIKSHMLIVQYFTGVRCGGIIDSVYDAGNGIGINALKLNLSVYANSLFWKLDAIGLELA